MAIGRVSVEVTPDARGFVAKMRADQSWKTADQLQKLGAPLRKKMTCRRRIV